MQNQQVLAQKQLESALFALEKQSLPKARTTLTRTSAKYFVQMVLQVRNLFPKEPELIQKLYSIMPMINLQHWGQLALKKPFLLKLEQVFEHNCGDTIRCYAFVKTEDDLLLLVHASVEKNAETGLYFIAQWKETKDTFLINRTLSFLEKNAR